MKLDERYTHQYICPDTGIAVNEHDYAYSRGVCHVCGNRSESTFTHATRIVGKWNRPNLFERLRGKKPEFIVKEYP